MRPGTGVNAETHRSVTGLPRWILPLGETTPPLSLNGRYHWRTRARHVRRLRTAVYVRGLQLKMRPVPHVHVTLHYVPRDRRARDADNLVATLKPCIDALTAKGRERGWPALGVVADDTPEHVSWSSPQIHPPDEHGPRLWIEVQALGSPPPPAGMSYGYPTNPTPEGSADG